MANTILVSTNVSLQRENELNLFPLLRISGMRLSQSGDAIAGSMQVATTAAANLEIGSVSNPAFAVFWNKDSTNYVSIGWDDTGFVEAVRIPAGWPAIIPLVPSITYQVQSNTANVNLYYQVLEA